MSLGIYNILLEQLLAKDGFIEIRYDFTVNQFHVILTAILILEIFPVYKSIAQSIVTIPLDAPQILL